MYVRVAGNAPARHRCLVMKYRKQSMYSCMSHKAEKRYMCLYQCCVHAFGILMVALLLVALWGKVHFSASPLLGVFNAVLRILNTGLLLHRKSVVNDGLWRSCRDRVIRDTEQRFIYNIFAAKYYSEVMNSVLLLRRRKDK